MVKKIFWVLLLLIGTVTWDSAAEADSLQRIVIFHFSDLGGSPQRVLPDKLVERFLYYRMRGILTVVVGSGDYVITPSVRSLGEIKGKVEDFISRSGCPGRRIFLALGNHDDPGRTTRFWNDVWQGTRPMEGVAQVGPVLVA